MARKVTIDVRRKGISDIVRKLPDAVAEKAAKRIASTAKSNFRNAYYDGPQVHLDAIRVTPNKRKNGSWEVVAEGYAVSFVEFGTGVTGENTYKGTVAAGYEYDAKLAGRPSHVPGNKGWYFTADPESLAYPPEQAYRYKRGKDEFGEEYVPKTERRYFGKSANGRSGWILERNVEKFVKDGGRIVRAKNKEGQYVTDESGRELSSLWRERAMKEGSIYQEKKDAERARKEHEDTFYTEGIEANNCLYDAVEYARTHLSEIVKGKK